MSDTYTPGPWHVSKHMDGRDMLVYDADRNRGIEGGNFRRPRGLWQHCVGTTRRAREGLTARNCEALMNKYLVWSPQHEDESDGIVVNAKDELSAAREWADRLRGNGVDYMLANGCDVRVRVRLISSEWDIVVNNDRVMKVSQ